MATVQLDDIDKNDFNLISKKKTIVHEDDFCFLRSLLLDLKKTDDDQKRCFKSKCIVQPELF